MRIIVSSMMTILFLFFTLCAGLAEDTADALKADNKPPVFSHLGPDSFLVASADNWYLEEYDALGRPVSGTRWKNGSIDERISWLYDDETQQVKTKVVTSSDGSVESDYDSSGNVIETRTTNAKGELISKTTNAYNKKNLLVKSETEADNTILLTQIDYIGGEISEKRMYRNDAPLITYTYKDSDNWTETVFKDGKPVLVVDYKNGERIKQNEQ